MSSSRFGFDALLKKVNPSGSCTEIAQRLPGEVRDWLEEHEFETRTPHSRLIGSYGRHTAILDIKDVDTLIFLPDEARDRTPEAVLRELKSVLEDYPDTTAETSPQRRSIRLDFPMYDLCMDLVGAVADDGLDNPLWVPDRGKQEWLLSDPLGYGRTLSEVNGENGGKLVPLIKLIKAWRDVQMIYRRPKSYLLEVIVFDAVNGGSVELEDRSTAVNVRDFFEHVEQKWEKLMDNGEGVPRVYDPQLGHVISLNWERTHFETFMRRIREAASSARSAVDSESDDQASPHWEKVFGSLWPTEEEVQKEARRAANAAVPGTAYVTSSGAVSSRAAASAVRTHPTTFHGASN